MRNEWISTLGFQVTALISTEATSMPPDVQWKGKLNVTKEWMVDFQVTALTFTEAMKPPDVQGKGTWDVTKEWMVDFQVTALTFTEAMKPPDVQWKGT